MTPTQAREEWRRWSQIVALLDDEPGIFTIWQDLVARYDLRGTRVFDANLVAAALHHRLEGILTLDSKDLRRYEPEGLKITEPENAV